MFSASLPELPAFLVHNLPMSLTSFLRSKSNASLLPVWSGFPVPDLPSRVAGDFSTASNLDIVGGGSRSLIIPR